MSVEVEVTRTAERAREASWGLGLATRASKDAALLAMAAALVERQDEVLAANAEDVRRAEAAGTPANIVDRLRLDVDRIAGMAQGLREVAGLPDPVGEVVRGSTLANGLELRQVRVPFGVVGIIYEARPNVTADAAGICLKSGNAALLRGSASALSSNTAIVAVLRDAIEASGLEPDAVQLVPGEGHDGAKVLMRARGLVDVLIPRGGAGLIRSVVEESTVPVIETGVGNCHVYVDAAADLAKALAIVVNAKTHRTSVCNAAESLLVHEDVADEFLPDGHRGAPGARGDPARRRALRGVRRRGRRPPRTTGAGSTSRSTSPPPSYPISRRRCATSAPTAAATPRPSSPRTSAPPTGSPPPWTPPRCWSTPRPGSPTGESSASVRRSGSAPRSCTPAAPWA